MKDEPPDSRLLAAADIVFTSSVHADRIRFEVAPDSSVTFHGVPDQESAAGSRRTRLPHPVSEHVTYHDVHIHYEIAAKLRTHPR